MVLRASVIVYVCMWHVWATDNRVMSKWQYSMWWSCDKHVMIMWQYYNENVTVMWWASQSCDNHVTVLRWDGMSKWQSWDEQVAIMGCSMNIAYTGSVLDSLLYVSTVTVWRRQRWECSSGELVRLLAIQYSTVQYANTISVIKRLVMEVWVTSLCREVVL